MHFTCFKIAQVACIAINRCAHRRKNDRQQSEWFHKEATLMVQCRYCLFDYIMLPDLVNFVSIQLLHGTHAAWHLATCADFVFDS